MGSTERREREKEQLRRKILDTARQMFANEGYDAVSMRRIAQKIEYSPTAIYLHFKDKESLFSELCNADFRRLAKAFASMTEVKDAVERLRKIGHAYIGFALEYPNHYRLMFMTPHPEEHKPEELDKGNPEEDAYAFLKVTVEACMKAGAFRPGLKNSELIAQTLWAGVHGVASLQIAKHHDHWVSWCPITERTEIMLESLLNGLLKQNGKEKK